MHQSMIRPIVTYAAPVWAHSKRTQINHLKILKNKLSHKLTNAPWFIRNADIHKDLKLQELPEHITTLTTNFMKSLEKKRKTNSH
jgi:hypothetical protein